MKQVGTRKESTLSREVSGAALASAVVFSADLSRLAGGRVPFPKGIFRYKSHEEANAHQAACLAQGMASLPKERMDDMALAVTIEDLKNLARSMDANGVDYLLIGGFALAAHGYERAITDIDLMVAPNADAGARIKAPLMVLPDRAAKDLGPEWFAQGENIRVGGEIILDIKLDANGLTYDTLKQYAQTVDVDEVPIRTVSLDGLLLTKRTMREKDRLDAVVIERALAVLQDPGVARADPTLDPDRDR